MTARVIKKPKYGASLHWPDGVVTIERVRQGFYDVYDVKVDGQLVGQLERRMGSHGKKIKGTRLISGHTRERAEWKVKDTRYVSLLWEDFAYRAMNKIFDQMAEIRP